MHEHHISENTGATVATAPVKNSVDGKDTFGGKTPTSLTSTKGHVVQLTPDNQKMSHMTTSLKKRRHLTDSGTSCSQPPKKLKEGNVVATKPQDRKVGDGLIKEVLCGFVSPDSASNSDTSEIPMEDQPSFDHSWDKKIVSPAVRYCLSYILLFLLISSCPSLYLILDQRLKLLHAKLCLQSKFRSYNHKQRYITQREGTCTCVLGH